MAVGESAGSVYVTIDGDASPLMAKFAQASASAASAGSRVASAFNAGATATDELSTSASLAALAEARFASATEASSAALGHQVSQLQATSGAIRTALGEQSIRAAERFLTMIPGIGVALQAAFPVIGALALFEAINRVVGKSEDLKKALEDQAKSAKEADDAESHLVATLDALSVKSIGRDLGPAAQAQATVTRLKMEAQDAQNALTGLQSKLKEVDINAQGGALTHPVGTLTGSFAAENAAKRQAIEEQIAKQLDIVQEKYAEAGDAALEAGKKATEQGGALAATQLENQGKALSQQTTMAKAVADAQIVESRAAADQRIASLQSEYARVVETGAAEIAQAQAKEKAITDILVAELPKRLALIRSEAAADAQGKPQSEQEKIFATAAGKETDVKGSAATEAFTAGQASTAAQNKATLSLIELNAKFATELRDNVTRGWDEVAKTAERSGEEQQKALLKNIALMVKEGEEASRAAEGRAHIAEEVGKGQGEIATARVKAQYEDQISHSIQQEVTYQEQLASIQDATYTKELTALAAKLKAAQALEDETEKAKQLLDLEAQIAALSGKAQAATISAQGAIGKTQAQGFGQQLGQAGTAGLSSLSTALAKGITDGGRGLGKDIRQSLQGIGKQMLGDAIKTSVEDLVIAMTGNTIATNLNTLWTEIQTLASKLFGFADGTDSAPGGFAMVGERGPEIMHVPKGAQIIPNHKIGKYADGTPNFSRATSRSSSMSIGELHVHAHGVSNPDAFARQAVAAIPHELKRQSSTFSPYSS